MTPRAHLRSLFACLLFIAMAGGALAADQMAIGSPIALADVKMKNIDGKTLSLDDVKGKNGTVVAFWCNHCPFVVRWTSRFVDLAKTYQAQGFGFIAINPNDPSKAKGDDLASMAKLAKEKSYSFPYVVDEGSKLALAYGATHTPHVYVFNADGKLVYVGAIDDNSGNADAVKHTYLKDALDALLAGKEIATAQSKAIGCTIKFYQ